MKNVDNYRKHAIICVIIKVCLIQSGRGTDPMKPGNQSAHTDEVIIPAAAIPPKDEAGLIHFSSSPYGGLLL